MLAEFLQTIFARLDIKTASPIVVNFTNPKDQSIVTGYFNHDGGWCPLAASGPKEFKFPSVIVHSADSLVDYAKAHADMAIEEGRAILYTNRTGLFLSIDYGAGEEAEEMKHRVAFPAAFDEECEVAASAIKDALGKWISLAVFDSLLDKCAPFIKNFAHLEEAASNMEGHETAKIAKTASSFQVQITGEVSCAVDIPKIVAVELLFMGHVISAEIPLRLTVQDKQIKFHLVDNGMIARAQMAVLRSIKAAVRAELGPLLSIDGKIA